MISIRDDHGYNQGFEVSGAMEVRMRRRCNYMVSKMNVLSDIEVLEIGCGTGEISYFLATKHLEIKKVVGIDVCSRFINEASEKYKNENLNYTVMDFSDTKSVNAAFGNKKFDYIVGNGILHHLYNNLDRSLKNMNFLLKNPGKLIFLEPNILNPYCFFIFNFPFFRKLANLDPGEMAFTKKFIQKKLSENGFIETQVEFKDFLIPGTPLFLIRPVIVLGRLLEKIPLIRNLSQSIYVTANKK
jgi:2-polyprenyl-3-methyl-5-hydroxy-6-metoxy-1,4-benzoquinol methylase